MDSYQPLMKWSLHTSYSYAKPPRNPKKINEKDDDEQRILPDHICGCWMSWARRTVRCIGGNCRVVGGGGTLLLSTSAQSSQLANGLTWSAVARWKAKLNCWQASSAFRRPFAAAATARCACLMLHLWCSAAAGGGVGVWGGRTECVDCCRCRWLATSGPGRSEMSRSRRYGSFVVRYVVRSSGGDGSRDKHGGPKKTKHSNWN